MTEKKKNTLNNVNLNHKENQNLKHTLSNKLNKLTTLNFGDFQVAIIASHFWISAFHQTFLESYRDRVFEAPLAKTLNNFNTMQAMVTKLVGEFS